jgi:hypothetical protein
MELNAKTVYVKEKDDGYTICIDMPDHSRNYLHCETIKELWKIQEYMKDILGLELDSVDIIKDDTYYRLQTTLFMGETADTELHFHSRKLNINDAFYERELLLNSKMSSDNHLGDKSR